MQDRSYTEAQRELAWRLEQYQQRIDHPNGYHWRHGKLVPCDCEGPPRALRYLEVPISTHRPSRWWTALVIVGAFAFPVLCYLWAINR